MTDIVAGRFEQQNDAQAAVERLLRHGFRRDDVSSFFVNPPGQHARLAVGGDRNVSPGARGAGRAALAGAVIGGVLGFVFGLAAMKVYGFAAAIAGALAGVYLGMLAGALARMQDRRTTRTGAPAAPEVRHAGIMVAAHTTTASNRDEAVHTLRSSGALDIETAEGEWRDGRWTSFDPTEPPARVPSPSRGAHESG